MITYISPFLLSIASRMINIFWAHGPISFQNMYFWCPFLDPHPTILHSNIGVCLRRGVELGMSTLRFVLYFMWSLLNIFECYMSRFVAKNVHQKDMCYNGITLRAQYILGLVLSSILNIIMSYVIIQGERDSSLWSSSTLKHSSLEGMLHRP